MTKELDWVEQVKVMPISKDTKALIISLSDTHNDETLLSSQLNSLDEFARACGIKALVIKNNDFSVLTDDQLAQYGLQRIPSH